MAKLYVDIRNVRSEEMRQKWQKIIDDGIDPFEPEHAKKDVGAILLETDHWYVFQNNYPYSDTERQLVIVTKEFFTDSIDLPEAVWLDLLTVQKTIRKQYDIPGGGLIMRFGDTSRSGGTVMHLHAQIVVPKEGRSVAAWFGSKKE